MDGRYIRYAQGPCRAGTITLLSVVAAALLTASRRAGSCHVKQKRWSKRTIDQMAKGSGSAEPNSPPSMVVLFSDDHSLPTTGYSSSLRHDRPNSNVMCNAVRTSESL
jgi:hypothetical protein